MGWLNNVGYWGNPSWPLWANLLSRLVIFPGLMFLLTWGVAVVMRTDDPLQDGLSYAIALVFLGGLQQAWDAFRRKRRNGATSE